MRLSYLTSTSCSSFLVASFQTSSAEVSSLTEKRPKKWLGSNCLYGLKSSWLFVISNSEVSVASIFLPKMCYTALPNLLSTSLSISLFRFLNAKVSPPFSAHCIAKQTRFLTAEEE